MSFFWYDYETLGRSASLDRPAQFAGIRTDEALRETEDPIVLYCRLSRDYLPDPDAFLVHGISPAVLMEHGLPEAEFAARIHEEISRPGTCCAGYNAIRFDHEVTRFLMYRNLRDPYGWHWENGNSKWDIIDLLRAAFALRPDGINWPTRDDEAPSFRLEDIAAANGIGHESPHEALVDVRTTIAVARLVRRRQPALFDYYFRLRSKHEAAGVACKPFVLVSSLIPARLGCASVMAPICPHPSNSNAIVVYDLRYDPADVLDLTPEELRNALFTRSDELLDHLQRPPLSVVRTNSCPFVAPVRVVDERVEARLEIDVGRCERHYRKLRSEPLFDVTVRKAYERARDEAEVDVDAALYSRGFIPGGDRTLLDRLLKSDFMQRHKLEFEDDRLPELVFRYCARNHPHALTDEERARWRAHCRDRHMGTLADGETPLDAFDRRIAELRSEHASAPDVLALLDELAGYGDRIRAWIS